MLPIFLQGTLGQATLSFGLSLAIIAWLHLVLKAWFDNKAWAMAIFVCPLLIPVSLAFFPNISPRSAFLAIFGTLTSVMVLATNTSFALF